MTEIRVVLVTGYPSTVHEICVVVYLVWEFSTSAGLVYAVIMECWYVDERSTINCLLVDLKLREDRIRSP